MSILLAPPATLNPSLGALSTAAYMRIASLTIAAYDYLITLPAESRLYKSSDRKSLGLVLFILIRYLSPVALVVSNVGFFYHGFTPKSCDNFFYVLPVLKVLQMMVSHAILGIRTYNIAQRNVWIGRTVALSAFVAIVIEWAAAMSNRIPQTTNGNCMIASSHPSWPLSTWTFALAAMLYDCLTLSISTFYLLKLRSGEASAASGLVKILLYDGLIYIIALTAVNVMNIFFYRSTDHSIQSSGVSLGYSITWIMSQRIIIHVREARAEQPSVVMTQMPVQPAVPSSLRFSKDAKGDRGLNQDTILSQDDSVNTTNDCDIRVRIERSVALDAQMESGESIERNVYASQKSTWDREYAV